MKILIIEDELSLARFMAKGLQQAGYGVEICSDGTSGMDAAATGCFDLILLDLMLPGMNGFDLLQNMRDFNIATPVVIISALSQTEQVVKGLDLGAVDYIRKPFEWEEMLARVRAAVKRDTTAGGAKITVDDLTIDLAARRVFRAGREIKLTAKEFLLLEYLTRHAGMILSRNQIMEHVWELDFDTGSNIVEVFMHQLRRKVDKGHESPLIETIVGLGYTLKRNNP